MKHTLILLLSLLALACTRNDLTLKEDSQGIFSPQPLSVQCDTCLYPVVMVHGFLASGDTWASFHQLFTSNGYKPNLLFAFDWNSLAQGANNTLALDAFINQVLAKTKATKVRLMGHSAGGGLGYTYLSDAARAAKVDGYVHVASSVQSGPAGPGGSVPTLNLWSSGDKIAQGGDIPGATNRALLDKDHYQVATSPEAFDAIFRFFHNKAPQTLQPTPESIVCIGGRVLTFGENKPMVKAKVELYPTNATTGQRLNAQPFETWISDSLGYWGPTNVPAETTFELVVTTATPSDRVIHYFREGFSHLNSLVYLRTLPPAGSLAGILLAGLPKSAGQTVMNVFSSSQAAVAGRDSLMVNGTLISTPSLPLPKRRPLLSFCTTMATKKQSWPLWDFLAIFPFSAVLIITCPLPRPRPSACD